MYGRGMSFRFFAAKSQLRISGVGSRGCVLFFGGRSAPFRAIDNANKTAAWPAERVTQNLGALTLSRDSLKASVEKWTPAGVNWSFPVYGRGIRFFVFGVEESIRDIRCGGRGDGFWFSGPARGGLPGWMSYLEGASGTLSSKVPVSLGSGSRGTGQRVAAVFPQWGSFQGLGVRGRGCRPRTRWPPIGICGGTVGREGFRETQRAPEDIPSWGDAPPGDPPTVVS